ncbi:hypothetical protein BN341_16140 [Helicobacter heilmannii ASB1.4]|uniref:Uncharacterized protein n=1 Tax=Helicobacter heilmannii TaxID=35817 RepID=A0A0K2YAH3_HELHE|nr:hypothetical protein BN341_16140 [Helicobacter heilmannii ASB1.4]CRI35187.1 hypothetical protein HHE01_01850 [Helicobacter heilmannii]
MAGTIRPLPILAQILLSASKLEQVLELGTKALLLMKLIL